jgi:hypothetical protein
VKARTAARDAVVGQALDVLSALLPSGWRIDRERWSIVDGERLNLVIEDPSGIGQLIMADVRLSARPMELQRTYPGSIEARSPSAVGDPILVVAPYLSPRSRSILSDAGINYLDLTGNVRLTLSSPGLSVLTEGTQRDPTPRFRPDQGIGGAAAGRIVRALADTTPPYSVSELASIADVSVGCCSRTLQALEREALVERDSRGTVRRVDWANMLRRRGSAVPLVDPRRTTGYIARTGVRGVVDLLAGIDADSCAITGSFAAARIRAVAASVSLVIYTPRPDLLAVSLDLLPADQGADAFLIIPADDGVFVGSSIADGIRWVAPSQIVVDCTGAWGRMPQEGEAVLEWMIEDEAEWRAQYVEKEAQ